jgi:hypothetical protein
LVVARDGVMRLQNGKRAERDAPIETKRSLMAWADPRQRDSFWVRAVGEASLRQYALASLKSPSDDGPRPPDAVQALPGFDSRVFAVLVDGTPAYSTSDGLALGTGKETPPAIELPEAATLLFADSDADRRWTADAEGHLALWKGAGDEPISTAQVPGIVIDAAHEGSRVAVLSMQLRGKDYQPSVTVFSDGRKETVLPIGPSAAANGQPALDLCVIPGRPWVVVGGRHWLQLLDWSGPRLLAEW